MKMILLLLQFYWYKYVGNIFQANLLKPANAPHPLLTDTLAKANCWITSATHYFTILPRVASNRYFGRCVETEQAFHDKPLSHSLLASSRGLGTS